MEKQANTKWQHRDLTFTGFSLSTSLLLFSQCSFSLPLQGKNHENLAESSKDETRINCIHWCSCTWLTSPWTWQASYSCERYVIHVRLHDMYNHLKMPSSFFRFSWFTFTVVIRCSVRYKMYEVSHTLCWKLFPFNFCLILILRKVWPTTQNDRCCFQQIHWVSDLAVLYWNKTSACNYLY